MNNNYTEYITKFRTQVIDQLANSSTIEPSTLQQYSKQQLIDLVIELSTKLDQIHEIADQLVDAIVILDDNQNRLDKRLQKSNKQIDTLLLGKMLKMW